MGHLKEYELRYYDGNDVWLERLVMIPEEALTALAGGESEFLVCYNEGKLLFVNKDLIYTIEEIKE